MHQRNELDLRHTEPGVRHHIEPENTEDEATAGGAVRIGYSKQLHVWAFVGMLVTFTFFVFGVFAWYEAYLMNQSGLESQEQQTYTYITGHEQPVTIAQPSEPGLDMVASAISTTTNTSTPEVADTAPIRSVTPSVPPSSGGSTTTMPPEAASPTPVQNAPEPQNSGLDYRYGIAMGETLSVQNEAELKRRLDDVAELGVGWIRVDLSWSSIQWQDSETYYWDAFDRIVREAKNRGIRVLPIVTYTPRWARPADCKYSDKCAPRDPEEFAAFVQVAVKRYAPQGVNTWEIWNEPNMGLFWAPHADPERYTELLKASYTAIKEIDSDAVIISGGLAPVATRGANMTARAFLEGIYIHGGKNYFDALGFHPYTYPVLPGDFNDQNAWSQMEETEWSLRGIMKYNNDGGKDIWLTEYGAPTGGPGTVAESGDFSRWRVPDHVTEEYQAVLLKEVANEAKQYGFVGPLFWYSYQDLGTNTEDRENFFGLRRHDGSAKPAYSTLQQLTQ